MITITVIGNLTKDPIGNDSYTMWKVRAFGKEITLFSQESSAEARLSYRNGMRIRGEGRGGWNEFNESFGLQLSNAAIDGSDSEDELKIKVDGSIGHELRVEQDDADEGGGKYIPVEIEAPIRVKDSSGEWGDGIAYVRAMVLGPAVNKLLKLDKDGVTSICFKGALDAEPSFIRGEVCYYAEIDDVEPNQGRGSGNDDEFWKSKPRGLANRRSAPAKPASAAAASAKKGGKGKQGYSDPGPNDEMPFAPEFR